MEQEIIEDYKRLFGDYDENSPIYAKNMNDLGEKYVKGDGIKTDHQKAYYCINISYKLGYPKAIDNLGSLYFLGYGVSKNTDKALRYFNDALSKGVKDALFSMAYYYFSLGIYNNAFLYAEKAMNEGVEAGFKILASMYLYGFGVQQNLQKAFELLQKGANMGLDKLLCYVGILSYYGIGTEPNNEEAMKWFQKAADLDDDKGVAYLNNYAYINGEVTNYESMFLNCPDDEISTSPYYVNIKKMLEAGAKVHSYQSIVDLTLEELDKLKPDDIVNIRYNNILYSSSIGDCYRVSDMKKLLLTCQKLLSDIDLNQPEEDIFMQVYIKLGLLLHYDDSDYSSAFNLRTLLNKNGVCQGIAVTLKALLDMAHIESKIVFTYCLPIGDHAFLQVKLNGKWYYCDLTWDLDNIKNGTIDYCLLSEESIQTSNGEHQVFNLTDKHEALEDFPNVLNLFRRNYKKIKKDNNSSMQEHRMSI